VRHGHATRITVSITQPNTQRLLFISIDNDGDPSAPLPEPVSARLPTTWPWNGISTPSRTALA
jgi:hypothetical protein